MSTSVHRTSVWTMEHGDVVVQFPAVMSPVEVDELEEYLAILVRGCRRAAMQRLSAAPTPEPPAAQPEGV